MVVRSQQALVTDSCMSGTQRQEGYSINSRDMPALSMKSLSTQQNQSVSNLSNCCPK